MQIEVTNRGPQRLGELVASAAEGIVIRAENDQRLFSLARKLRGAGLSRDEARQRLLEAARQLDPPIPEAEVDRKLSRLYGHGADSPALRAVETSGKKQLLPEPLALRPIGELLAEEDEEVAWLLDGLLPRAGLSVMTGKPKAGKSTFLRALAVAVAQGREFLGRRVERGVVFFLALDRDPRTAMRQHFRALGARPGDPLYLFDDVTPADAVARLQAAATEQRPALVIVDTLQRLARVRDISNYAETTTALTPIINLARETGSHILLSHHNGKREYGELVDAPLGSIAIAGSVDVVMVLRRRGEVRTLATVQRFGHDLPETVLELTPGGWPVFGQTWEDRALDQVEQQIVEYLSSRGEPVPEKPDIRRGVEASTVAITRALRELCEQGRVLRSGSGKKGDPYRYRLADSGFRVLSTSVEPAEPEFSNGPKSSSDNTYAGSGFFANSDSGSGSGSEGSGNPQNPQNPQNPHSNGEESEASHPGGHPCAVWRLVADPEAKRKGNRRPPEGIREDRPGSPGPCA
jgi:hypothetical protein